ncbi:restriction endonuclease subunit S [Aegicerativicinus sediminis]|uniref:restriction endonuclease subunit S n=1 Tax=Aegicerativicinus sediminis TaxID=2893202 RepID=UPI001E579CEC|nr:restriction endonuclease subunit S [Aegicerativicinus sediminis]
MERYSAYKDSGVEWIGDIPSHWIINKFNREVYFQEGPGLRTFQFTEDGTKVICVTNITETGIEFDKLKKYISEEEYLKKYQHFTVQNGDYLLSSSGNSWGKVCEYKSDEKVILNTSTIRLNSLNPYKLDKRLIPHILNSNFVKIQLEILMTGSCQPNFGPSHLNQLLVPVPDYAEQQKIVEFLDDKTAKIDRLLQIKEKKIELLKEKRTSLINQVVTKGLDPNVEMKDSGVEWIGEIPKHWATIKLKYLCEIVYGISPPDTTYNYEGLGSILINGPVEYSKKDFGYTRSLKWTTDPKKFTSKGSLLFCLRGSTTGRMNITHADVSIGRGVCSLKSKESQWFMIYSMMMLRIHIQKQISGSTFPSVTKDDVDNYLICHPPLEEQNGIAKYLDIQTNEIDRLIKLEQKKIELLKEYRQSLISEVITGKIKVFEEVLGVN